MTCKDDSHLAAILSAYSRISDIAVQTPLLESKWLSSELGCSIYLKMESEQLTGSFKLRGATNKLKCLLELSKINDNEQVLTASSGNHALACAYASSKLGVKMTIYTYKNILPAKEEKISRYSNVELKKVGSQCGEAEVYAREEALKTNKVFISPYNDIEVIYGQATVAVEMLKQNPDLDVLFVSVGGGGLISGISMYVKLTNPNIKIIACQPKNDPCMYESINAGHIVDEFTGISTISDGTAGSVEKGAITFNIINQYVDEWVLLEEEEIELALYDMMTRHNKVVEGAAGLVIAGARKLRNTLRGKNVGLVICGANLGFKNKEYVISKFSKPTFDF